jgi:hypothetical protein
MFLSFGQALLLCSCVVVVAIFGLACVWSSCYARCSQRVKAYLVLAFLISIKIWYVFGVL